MFKGKSFFERLTGGIRLDDSESPDVPVKKAKDEARLSNSEERKVDWNDEHEDAELSVDVYQTPNDVIVETMVAGVKPEDLSINITRDMIIIKGKRESSKIISEENYLSRELYWGSFARTIILPQEVEPEEAEAIERHGLLVIKIPKVDRAKKTMLKVKSV